MTCPDCGNEMFPPITKNGNLHCKSCERELGWAHENMWRNAENEDRVARERARNNKAVVRSHRLKK
jgi:uncharacterized Zn finger protein (UPF0148 family)